MATTFRHPEEEPRGERRQNTKDLRHELTARAQFWGWVDFSTALDAVASAALREGYTPMALQQIVENAVRKAAAPAVEVRAEGRLHVHGADCCGDHTGACPGNAGVSR